MSDSDDNAYSDYLESRRAALQKKRPPVRVYESDSDDDFPAKDASKNNKRKREALLEDSDEDSVKEKPVSHDQQLKNRIDHVEEEYRRKLFSKKDTMIYTQTTKNDAIKKAIKMCQSMDIEVKTMRKPEDEEEEEEEPQIEEVEDAADSSAINDIFPVTVVVVDCESRLSTNAIRNLHDVPLESTFNEVRINLATKWNCSSDEVVLTHEGKTVEAEETPKDLGFRSMQIPHPLIEASKQEREEPPVFTVEGTPESITVKVQLKNRKKPVHVQANAETTIQDIKQIVIDTLMKENERKIPSIDKMKVMFDDEYINDMTVTCKELGLEDADCIDIYF